VAVGLAAQQGEGRLDLTVWDGGPPIDADERQTIFDRGVRGRRGAQRPGTGLGLALARDLAVALGGTLELLPSPATVNAALPGAGNAFRLSLPAPASPPGR
jgi:signal transduction histidine kinase